MYELQRQLYPEKSTYIMEERIKKDLYQYLLSINMIDERLPECTDIEDKWQTLAEAYLPDGIREFNNYPTVSL